MTKPHQSPSLLRFHKLQSLIQTIFCILSARTVYSTYDPMYLTYQGDLNDFSVKGGGYDSLFEIPFFGSNHANLNGPVLFM